MTAMFMDTASGYRLLPWHRAYILAFEDEGRVVWFEGNYADYEADRKRRLGAEAERPHRLRYKRLPAA